MVKKPPKKRNILVCFYPTRGFNNDGEEVKDWLHMSKVSEWAESIFTCMVRRGLADCKEKFILIKRDSEWAESVFTVW